MGGGAIAGYTGGGGNAARTASATSSINTLVLKPLPCVYLNAFAANVPNDATIASAISFAVGGDLRSGNAATAAATAAAISAAVSGAGTNAVEVGPDGGGGGPGGGPDGGGPDGGAPGRPDNPCPNTEPKLTGTSFGPV